jgi:acyl dehydratase
LAGDPDTAWDGTWDGARPAPVHLGNFYEDFEVGTVYHHRNGRTITEADNIWFTLLTNNTNPLHFDRPYAEAAALGGLLVNSTLTLAVVTGLSVPDISENAVANLGWDRVALPNPVRVGDTIRAATLIAGTRASRSRPYAGIVETRTRGTNQDGAEVISFDRTILVYRRGHGPRFLGAAGDPR